MPGKFELKQSVTGQFYFSLLAPNGQIILQSAMYDSKDEANKGIEAVIKNAKNEDKFVRHLSSSRKAFFGLMGDENILIAQSQMYETEAGRDNGIEAVKRSVVNVETTDFSKNTKISEKTKILKVDSLPKFLELLDSHDTDSNFVYYFRGHDDFRYELKPSIYRNSGLIENENIIFRELILRCPSDFNSGDTTFQNLVKMQHYFLPTRLLDLTANPLIALYFATSEEDKTISDGEVIVFKVPKDEIKYFDSDTVSVIANLSKRKIDFEIPKEKLSTKQFNNKKQLQFLLHEIRNEKPYFQPLIKKEHLESVLFVKPMLDNQRIIKQDGAFCLFGIMDNKKQNAEIPERYIASKKNRIIISATNKKLIREQLRRLGVTQKTIFPEIDKVADDIKKEFLI